MDQNTQKNLVKETPRQAEERFEIKPEKEKEIEKTKEQIQEEADIKEELQDELSKMSLDENLKALAEQKAKKIKVLGDDEKLKHLLDLAKTKGVLFAVDVAKSMNDPYILDIFHDLLVKEGYGKKI